MQLDYDDWNWTPAEGKIWLLNICKTDLKLVERENYPEPDCTIRRSLVRIWDKSKACILFIMRNPATPCIRADDVTIKRAIWWALSRGYGGIYVGNLFPYCAKDLDQLRGIYKAETAESQAFEHASNDAAIRDMISKCDKVICAWGDFDPFNYVDGAVWLDYLRTRNMTPYCIRSTVKKRPIIPTWTDFTEEVFNADQLIC